MEKEQPEAKEDKDKEEEEDYDDNSFDDNMSVPSLKNRFKKSLIWEVAVQATMIPCEELWWKKTYQDLDRCEKIHFGQIHPLSREFKVLHKSEQLTS